MGLWAQGLVCQTAELSACCIAVMALKAKNVVITSPKESLIPDLGEWERGWTWDVQFDYLGAAENSTGSVIVNFSERDHYAHDCHQQRSAVWG